MTARSLIPVLVACMLLTGCCNTLLTKYQDMQCVANCKSPNPARHKTFEQPVIQTLQMFIGESGSWLVVFGAYIYNRLRTASSGRSSSDPANQPLIASEEDDNQEEISRGQSDHGETYDPTNIVAKPLASPAVGVGMEAERMPLQGWKVFLLALPACCDIAGTTLMNVGLLYVAASIYQMTRGALVLFVGLFSVIFLKRHLTGWKWASLFIVVLGVAVVGLAGVIENKQVAQPDHDKQDLKTRAVTAAITLAKRLVDDVVVAAKDHTAAETILGVLLIAGAQIFTAFQFVLEENIMERYALDPLKVVGWEGFFGVIVTAIGMGILHATVGQTAAGQGGYFDAREGFSQVFHNRTIAVTSLLIMVSVGGFNFFGLSVTRSISATSRSTIDTCRTLFIWIISLGLGWESFKWLQVLGFALLVYGTGVFNEIVRPPALGLLRRRVNNRDGGGGGGGGDEEGDRRRES